MPVTRSKRQSRAIRRRSSGSPATLLDAGDAERARDFDALLERAYDEVVTARRTGAR
jgi:hypothetical protein